jgi:hypothetical protein
VELCHKFGVGGCVNQSMHFGYMDDWIVGGWVSHIEIIK